jgi:hypothetical protein
VAVVVALVLLAVMALLEQPQPKILVGTEEMVLLLQLLEVVFLMLAAVVVQLKVERLASEVLVVVAMALHKPLMEQQELQTQVVVVVLQPIIQEVALAAAVLSLSNT